MSRNFLAQAMWFAKKWLTQQSFNVYDISKTVSLRAHVIQLPLLQYYSTHEITLAHIKQGNSGKDLENVECRVYKKEGGGGGKGKVVAERKLHLKHEMQKRRGVRST